MAPSENVPVFLLHGWAGSFTDTWKKPGIDALLEDIGRTVVGIDLLGHGDQEKPHDPEAYSQLPEWFISQIDATYPVIDAVGFSLGALTLLRAVLLQPHRFRRVVLAGIGNGVFEQAVFVEPRNIPYIQSLLPNLNLRLVALYLVVFLKAFLGCF